MKSVLIILKGPDEFPKENMNLTVPADISIINLMKEINSKCSYLTPDWQALFYGETELSDRAKTLSDFGIQNGATLYIRQPYIHIRVNNKIIKYPIKSTKDNVSDIKSFLRKEQPNLSTFELYFTNNLLNSDEEFVKCKTAKLFHGAIIDIAISDPVSGSVGPKKEQNTFEGQCPDVDKK